MNLTIVPSIHNVSSTLFSCRLSGFDSSSSLTYSTLQIVHMGEGSSTAPLQGYFVGTTTLFNVIHYGGGHIPPLSPSLGGDFQHSFGLNINSILFNGGSHGP